MIGGYDYRGDLNSMERFDPREGNNCVQMKEMKESRSWAASAGHKGLIYVTGGMHGNNCLDTVEMFAIFVFFFYYTLLKF